MASAPIPTVRESVAFVAISCQISLEAYLQHEIARSQGIQDAAGNTLVCHAPDMPRHVKRANGKPLVEGKNVTGFTNTREEGVGLTKVVSFLVENELEAKKRTVFQGGRLGVLRRRRRAADHLTEPCVFCRDSSVAAEQGRQLRRLFIDENSPYASRLQSSGLARRHLVPGGTAAAVVR